MGTYTPGTLYEYDMILSLKQSGINAQLLNLYNTPNPDSDDPDDTLISHTLNLGFEEYVDKKTGQKKKDQAGLTANIECPKIDINAVLNHVHDDPYKSRGVQLSIKMKTGTLTYWDRGDLESRKTDGWTFKWDANLGVSNIQDIEEEVIHPKVREALRRARANLKDTHGIPEEDFLPSAIMCLFESTKLMATLKLFDENGKDMVQDAIVEAFITHISTTFRNTGKYPWVLGYGIAVKPIADPRPGSPMFLPSRFWLSTTPAKAVNGRWVDPDDATLNFCMINSDVHDERKVDPTRNWYAGILAEPFDVTTKATNMHTDGTFAMSSNMFFNHWIKPVIFDSFDVKNYDYRGGDTPKITRDEGGRSSSKVQDWSYTSTPRRGGIPSPDPPEPIKYSGTIWCDVQYTSTFLDGGHLDPDTLRRIVVDITGSDSTRNVPPKMELSLEITPGSSGDWAFKKIKWPNGPNGFDNLNHGADKVVQVIWKAVSSPGTVYVMPNGDLFDFNGLDCDETGNLYSHIKYKI
ncbi:hypothetical protein NM688_g5657 [Phlebia brevispora]|uniref:Uncharacterized protein n=1 Tax=Phlebia brevispora TaxID=194682 RepID=A0ACC1SRX5_9APHY|nr:hypothetical protein NM688_g5657 [Phlebia brevispora]